MRGSMKMRFPKNRKFLLLTSRNISMMKPVIWSIRASFVFVGQTIYFNDFFIYMSSKQPLACLSANISDISVTTLFVAVN